MIGKCGKQIRFKYLFHEKDGRAYIKSPYGRKYHIDTNKPYFITTVFGVSFGIGHNCTEFFLPPNEVEIIESGETFL